MMVGNFEAFLGSVELIRNFLIAQLEIHPPYSLPHLPHALDDLHRPGSISWQSGNVPDALSERRRNTPDIFCWCHKIIIGQNESVDQVADFWRQVKKAEGPWPLRGLKVRRFICCCVKAPRTSAAKKLPVASVRSGKGFKLGWTDPF